MKFLPLLLVGAVAALSFNAFAQAPSPQRDSNASSGASGEKKVKKKRAKKAKPSASKDAAPGK